MIEQACKDGVANEKVMNASIDSVDALLLRLKDAHPDVYEDFIAKQYELLYGPHYNEMFAEMAVADLAYTDVEGKQHKGAYWSPGEVEDATRGMSFPAGTTKFDKYVAFNVFKSDTCKALDDKEVIAAGYQFFFADEDYKGIGKIWHYMHALK